MATAKQRRKAHKRRVNQRVATVNARSVSVPAAIVAAARETNSWGTAFRRALGLS